MSETTSEPPIYSPFDPVAWQHIGQNLLSTVPDYDPNEPWYQKALDYASIPGRMMWGGIKGIGEGADVALHSPNLLQDPYAQHQLTQSAISTAGLTIGMPVRPAGSLGVFGGMKAATADAAQLAKAREMSGIGMKEQSIWESTGWDKGPGGDWRFEIPDRNANLYGQYLTPHWTIELPSGVDPPKLGDVLHHQALYDAYPALKDIAVHSTSISGVLGWYDGHEGVIGLKSGLTPEAARSTLLHEIQHAVQHIEGFPKGGNPQEFLPENFDKIYNNSTYGLQGYHDNLMGNGINPATLHSSLLKRAAGTAEDSDNNLIDHARTVLSGWQSGESAANSDKILGDFQRRFTEFRNLHQVKRNALNQYMNLAGEVESQMVEERKDYPAYSRRMMQPAATPGHLSGQLDIKRYDFPPHFSLEPVDHDPFAQ